MHCDLQLTPISSFNIYLIMMMVRMLSSSPCLHIVLWCLLGPLHARGIEHFPDRAAGLLRVAPYDHLTLIFPECQQYCLNLAHFCFNQGGLGWWRRGGSSSLLWDSWR